MMPTKEQIIAALKTVIDPEIHADVYTLGLIYDIKVGENGIDILMTLTTPFCPYGDEIVQSRGPRRSHVRTGMGAER